DDALRPQAGLIPAGDDDAETDVAQRIEQRHRGRAALRYDTYRTWRKRKWQRRTPHRHSCPRTDQAHAVGADQARASLPTHFRQGDLARVTLWSGFSEARGIDDECVHPQAQASLDDAEHRRCRHANGRAVWNARERLHACVALPFENSLPPRVDEHELAPEPELSHVANKSHREWVTVGGADKRDALRLCHASPR